MPIEPPIDLIIDGVFLFTPSQHHRSPWQTSSNTVFLSGENGVTMIDSGGASTRKQLIPATKKMVVNEDMPLYCLHTHGHIDHIGGDPFLQRKYNAEIFAPQEEITLVEKQLPLDMKEEKKFMIIPFRELFSMPEWFMRIAMPMAYRNRSSVTSVKSLSDSPNPGKTGFLPVPLPGHSRGHVGFFDKERGVLITGDLLDPRYGMKPLLVTPSADFVAMRSSLQDVIDLAPDILIPSHGGPIMGKENITQSITQAKEKLDAALNKTVVALEDGPHDIAKLSMALRGSGIGPGDVLRRLFIHSILNHLLAEGLISRQETRRRTYFALL